MCRNVYQKIVFHWSQIVIFNYYPPLKRIRSHRRNGCFQVWGKIAQVSLDYPESKEGSIKAAGLPSTHSPYRRDVLGEQERKQVTEVLSACQLKLQYRLTAKRKRWYLWNALSRKSPTLRLLTVNKPRVPQACFTRECSREV